MDLTVITYNIGMNQARLKGSTVFESRDFNVPYLKI